MLVKRNSPVSCDLHDVADHIKQCNKAFNKKHIKIIANNVPQTVCFTENDCKSVLNLCLLQLTSAAIATPTNHLTLP